MPKKQDPIEDDGTKEGYYRARRERRQGVTPSAEEVDRRRAERARREREEGR